MSAVPSSDSQSGPPPEGPSRNPTLRDALAAPELRRSIAAIIRKRVPPTEVDDLVQATLADAFASRSAPDDREALARWVRGIARHKIADYHRRTRREVPVEPETVEHESLLVDAHESHDAHHAHDAADILRWAEREAPGDGAQRTLDWLLREGDGEKLESIAKSEGEPAPRVRQRVTRLRRHYRLRWAAQIAAALAVLTAVTVLGLYAHRLRSRSARVAPPPATGPSMEARATPSVVPSNSAPGPDREREPPNEADLAVLAAELRYSALDQCTRKEWAACLEGLDRAKAIDPVGDSADEVQRARRMAVDAQKPQKPLVWTDKKPASSTPPAKKASPPDVVNAFE